MHRRTLYSLQRAILAEVRGFFLTRGFAIKLLDDWTEWRPLPDPRRGDHLSVPLGSGVYELPLRVSKELILSCKGSSCAFRMSSLLPAPLGRGTRRNSDATGFRKIPRLNDVLQDA